MVFIYLEDYSNNLSIYGYFSEIQWIISSHCDYFWGQPHSRNLAQRQLNQKSLNNGNKCIIFGHKYIIYYRSDWGCKGCQQTQMPLKPFMSRISIWIWDSSWLSCSDIISTGWDCSVDYPVQFHSTLEGTWLVDCPVQRLFVSSEAA